MSTHPDGFRLTQDNAVPLKEGGFAYWNAHLQAIARGPLSPSHPNVRTQLAEDGTWDKFTATFRLDDPKGREMCASSTSLENPKTKIPTSEIDALVASLDQFHKLAEDPAATGLAKDFIRGYRVPDPRQMRSAWRVSTNGPVKRLLLLWGWYPKGGFSDTVLPLTPTSRKWDDVKQRVDLKEALAEAQRLTPSRYNWPWIFSRVFLGLLLAALLGLLGFLGCNVFKPRYCDVHPSSRLVRGDGLIPAVCTNTCSFAYEDGSVCGQHLDAEDRCPDTCAFVYDDGSACGAHLGLQGICPNTCNVVLDSGVPCGNHLDQNGFCPYHPIPPEGTYCGICGTQLDEEGRCPHTCAVTLDSGDVCGTHLDPEGRCPNACGFTFDDGSVCGQHPDGDGKYPCHCKALTQDNSVCDTHLSPDGSTCPNAENHKHGKGEEKDFWCEDHPGTSLVDGYCPVRCPEPLKSNASGHGHPNSNWRGWAPNRPPNACGAHLNPDYSCPNAQNHVATNVYWCVDHPDTALVKGKCRWTCPSTPLKGGGFCHAHLNPDYSCPNAQNHEETVPLPKTCDTHPDVFLVNGVCPKICLERLQSGKTCFAHLNADLSCPNVQNHYKGETCRIHPDTFLVDGVCPKKCSHPYDDGSICGEHLHANGTCRLLCPVFLDSGRPCATHLDRDGSCPNEANHPKTQPPADGEFCKIHPQSVLVDGFCTNRCGFKFDDGSVCGTHLLPDGNCPNLCPVFLDNGQPCGTHLRIDGSCPNEANHPHWCPVHPLCRLKGDVCPMRCKVAGEDGTPCDNHLDADGNCPIHDVLHHCYVHNRDILPIGSQICNVRCRVDRGDGLPCYEHLDADFKCPIHDKIVQPPPTRCPVHHCDVYDGVCPERCPVVENGEICNRHLDAQGRCPLHGTREKEEIKGLVIDLPPVIPTNSPIISTNSPVVDNCTDCPATQYSLELRDRGQQPDGSFRPVFALEPTPPPYPGASIQWSVDGNFSKEGLNTSTFRPVFPDSSPHVIEANMEWTENEKQHLGIYSREWNPGNVKPDNLRFCPDHPDTRLVNGVCPNVCTLPLDDGQPCGRHLQPDGNCPDHCTVRLDSGAPCGTHLNRDGSCPNASNHPKVQRTCPDHPGIPLVNRKCPKVCPIHPDVHLDRNFNCKRCDTPQPPPTPACSIILRDRGERHDGSFRPVFALVTQLPLPSGAAIRWDLDGMTAEGETSDAYSPAFPDASPHRIGASVDWVHDGQQRTDSAEYEWNPGLTEEDEEGVYRDIVQIERRDGDGEYVYVYALKSSPDSGNASVRNWMLYREQAQLKSETEGQNLLVHGKDIGGEADLTFIADLQLGENRHRDVEKTYRFSYDPIAVSDSLSQNDASAIQTAAQGVLSSVFWISVPEEDGKVVRGTAFAIGSKRLLTNYHVVDTLSRGAKVELFQANSPTRLEGVVAATDPVHDLALVEVTDANIRLKTISPAKTEPVAGDPIACVGFPWSSKTSEEGPQGLHEPTVTAGTVQGIVDNDSEDYKGKLIKADALTLKGNSGGPAVDASGDLVGAVRCLFIQSEDQGEILTDGSGIIPVSVIKAFLGKVR